MNHQKIQLIFICLFFLTFPGLPGQVTEAEKSLRTASATETSGWKSENNLSITFSQVTFSYWADGGQNSISVNGGYNGIFKYARERFSWDNQADIGVGLLIQGKHQHPPALRP